MARVGVSRRLVFPLTLLRDQIAPHHRAGLSTVDFPSGTPRNSRTTTIMIPLFNYSESSSSAGSLPSVAASGSFAPGFGIGAGFRFFFRPATVTIAPADLLAAFTPLNIPFFILSFTPEAEVGFLELLHPA